MSSEKPQNDTLSTWIDDFQNFRSAISQNDLNKQKAYFTFPLNADTTQIWEAVFDQSDESERPAIFPSAFTETDYEKYHQDLFNENFVAGLLKLKIEVLAKKGEDTTPEIKRGKDTFYMIAHFNASTSMLQLTVSYPGGTDEDGNYVSEGEYAAIYFFRIENNRYLKFDKILFAG